MHPLLGEPSPTSTTAAMDYSNNITTSSSRLIESSAPFLIPQPRRNVNLHHHPQIIMSYESPAAETDDHHDDEVVEDLVKMSRSIPIQQNHMKRTASEIKLCEDEEMADFRDYIFFTRVIDGIARQQLATESSWLRQENNECLAHIIGTRTGGASCLLDEDDECRNPACRASSSSSAIGGEQSRNQQQGMNNDLSPDDATAVDTSGDEIFVMDL
jgi:hypothetical protein